MNRKVISLIAAIGCAFLLTAATEPAVPAAGEGADPVAAPRIERREIEKNVNCTCEDNCGKLLANCVCGFSDSMREEIDRLIAAGLTKPEIFEALVKRYGARVLASPGTSHWLDRLAWLVPFAALLLGAWLVVRVVRRFVAKPADDEAAARPEPGDETPESAAPSAFEQKLEDELSRFES